MRPTLRAQLTSAWKSTICNQYNNQLINSERGLQSYFCAVLLGEFEKRKMNRRLFIEPKISFEKDESTRHPDIVICDSKSIIGVVEVKYVPRGKPTYEKDLETLRLVLNNSEAIRLSNDRFRGVIKAKPPYSLAPDALVCWAGVHSGSAIDLSQKFSGDTSRFLQLSALTVVGEAAKVV